MRPLGTQQRKLLLALASPAMLQLTPPCAVTRSLIRRGLLTEVHGGARITPAGMRAVADEYEAGRLDGFMTKVPPKQHARHAAKTRKGRG